jgi:DNA polymerase beta
MLVCKYISIDKYSLSSLCSSIFLYNGLKLKFEGDYIVIHDLFTPRMDQKAKIINMLEVLRKKEIANKEPFKAKAYATVIKNLTALDTPIFTYDDLKGIKGIGEKIKAKLLEFFETGIMQAVENASKDTTTLEIQELMKVHGIGPAKAKNLVDEHGIRTLEQLEQNAQLLNDKQKMGLKYYKDFLERIPRKEMDAHREYLTSVIQAVDPRFVFEITGSYRRGLPTSGDIDILITHQDDPQNVEELFKTIVQKLKDTRYICDVFAEGGKKCLAVCKLPRRRKYRRIDLLYSNKKEYPFALLYFTGDAQFNIAMRNHSQARGLSLSEHGLKDEKTGQYVDIHFNNEQDIFEYLEMPYVLPNKRNTT